jgi:hypothetical protein
LKEGGSIQKEHIKKAFAVAEMVSTGRPRHFAAKSKAVTAQVAGM